MIKKEDILNYLKVKDDPTVDPPRDFKILKTNGEKLRFCMENYPSLWSNKNPRFAFQNDNTSMNARKEGNIKFKESNYVKAFELYNKSLSYATVGSENIPLCYANRSAVYFNAGLFKFCLENVDLALQNGYPEHLKHKLEKRRKECLEKMNKNRDKSCQEVPPLQLSYPAKAKNPFIIDGLDLLTSEESGKFIQTKQDLFPGDIIMIEKPYVTKLDPGFEYTMCNNCLLQKSILRNIRIIKSASNYFCKKVY
uniref:CSON001816 protein n=1 Tax=Culicoides sonorensis TaxID=179676 RepID=A0A336LRY4_CULSO